MTEKRAQLDKERAAFVDRLTSTCPPPPRRPHASAPPFADRSRTDLAESQSSPVQPKALDSAPAPAARVGIVREGRLMLKKTSALGGWRMRTFQIKEDGTLVWFKARSPASLESALADLTAIARSDATITGFLIRL